MEPAPSLRSGRTQTQLLLRAVLTLLVVISVAGHLGCAQPQATAAAWKFAVICDTRGTADGSRGSADGVRTSVIGPMARAMVADGVDLLIVPGDLVLGAAAAGALTQQLTTWRATMAPLYGAHIPIYAVRGNHELAGGVVAGGLTPLAQWRSVMTDVPQDGPAGEEGLTYRVVHNNATFVGFDQYIGRQPGFKSDKYDSAINAGMINPWVVAQVQTAPAGWVFAFGHEPAFVEQHTDCLANVPAERDALWDALGPRHGVYFCGHDHFYLRAEAPDARQNTVMELVVGSGGAGFYGHDNEGRNATLDRGVVPQTQFFNGKGSEKPYYGYLLVTVNGNQATGEWKAFTNYDDTTGTAAGDPKFEVLDRFVLTLP